MKKTYIPILVVALLFSGIGAGSGYYLKNNTDIIKNSPLAGLAGVDSSAIVTPVSKEPNSNAEVTYDNRYVLFSGFPVSEKNKNMLIALYDNKEREVNYFPYNYYTGIQGKEILSFLSEEELISFFKDKGLDIADEGIFLDQEDVFSVYVNNFEVDSYITLIEEDKETEKKVGTKEDFYRMIKDYSNQSGLQEQVLNTMLVSYIIQEDDELIDYSDVNDNLYGDSNLLSITEKPLIEETKQVVGGNGIKVLEDKNFAYIKAIADGSTPSKTPVVIKEEPKEIKSSGGSILDQLKNADKKEVKPMSIKERLLLER